MSGKGKVVLAILGVIACSIALTAVAQQNRTRPGNSDRSPSGSSSPRRPQRVASNLDPDPAHVQEPRESPRPPRGPAIKSDRPTRGGPAATSGPQAAHVSIEMTAPAVASTGVPAD